MTHGWDVQVYTEWIEDLPFDHDYPITTRKVYRNKRDWAIKAAWSLLTDWRNRSFSRFVQRQEGKNAPRPAIVLCTTFSTFPLRAARDLARSLGVPFIADIRDVDEQVPGAQYQSHRAWWTKPFRAWYSQVNIRRRNKVLREATALTTISPWHVEFLKQFNTNVHLVYNGYDERVFKPEHVSTDQFYIRYIGRLYDFQTEAAQLVREAVEELGMDNIVLEFIHAGLTREQVVQKLNSSSVVLVFTSKATHGMMTTKFYEALGCERPVLCVPDDEGVLANTIRSTHAGGVADTKEQIKQFLLERYNEWQLKGYTQQRTRNNYVYSRAHQAEQFESILNNSVALKTRIAP